MNIKQRWQNYVNRYPYKWQWWISGFIWGILAGKWFGEIQRIHTIWQPVTVENFTWWNAALLTFDVKFDILESQEDFQNWFANHGFTLRTEQEDTTRT